ncbi:L-type lectin-domain containing receptor kinase V.9 [Raphanus sativus]|uniref:non-specific serine/threonine protein kinase n=1 Tax=Raphanus sativus TaxID=3726 RepID=A0A6J0KUF5_RAPSA|nr:L-type lectin-domain containing receptor kinase V.9-like [Raphanus sativus]KAJ4880498.1 L-type lectin-domain containing receptor kinase V.9 [Raphanus sativus]
MFVVLLLLLLNKAVSQGERGEFGFDGYLYDSYGSPNLDSNGLVKLTNYTEAETCQVFYNFPVPFKDSPNGTVSSFSTTFVFAISSKISTDGGPGIAFAISPTKGLPYSYTAQYLGLFNTTSNGNSSNHVVAVEFDTALSPEFGDISDNHVGIDINSLTSVKAASAGYYKDDGTFENISLKSGKRIQAWVEYDSSRKQLSITLHPLHVAKPKRPLLSLTKDLSPYLLESMYVGFTSSTGYLLSSHYILGWTFKLNGKASDIDPSRLPKLPDDYSWSSFKKILAISLSMTGLAVLIFLTISFMLFLKRKKLMEVLEDWEVQFGPHRFAYKDLYIATKGFKNSELLGKGGFGKVYKGTLLSSNLAIAVKKVSHDSRQGMREFIAEIATIGRLRHPNLVRLLGYCRRKGELYLVYDCMSKGSLDKFLYHQPEQSLDWSQRFKIIRDVASGLCYLHQQWVQVIIHRDIKPANILLDESMNAKLGDFGLAKLCEHGIDPQTSNVAGTFGYISPELSRTGKASTSSDVFAFGVFMLEITCGRRPVLPRVSSLSEMVLTDWVLDCWEDDILQVVDERVKHDDKYLEQQVTMVLKLGLLCSHPVAAVRPSMSSVIQFLDGVAQLPHNLLDIVQARENFVATEATVSLAQPSSIATVTFTESFASHGR